MDAPTQRSGAPPGETRRPQDPARTRTNPTVAPATVRVSGVVEVDLSRYADGGRWIHNVPISAYPAPPPGALVRLRLGNASAVGRDVLLMLAQLVPVGCHIEVSAARADVVAEVVRDLRSAIAMVARDPQLGGAA
jgi:hypothetical protein